MYEFLNVVDFASTYNTILFFGMVMCAPLFAVAWISINEFIEGEKIVVENDWFWCYSPEEIFCIPSEMQDWPDHLPTTAGLGCWWLKYDEAMEAHDDGYPLALLEEYFWGHTMEHLEEALSCLPGQSVVWDEWDRANDTDDLADPLVDDLDALFNELEQMFQRELENCPA